MEYKNHLIRGVACNNQYRFFVVDSTDVVQKAMDLHQTAPAPALLLGRLLTAALLMGADLKDNVTRLILNVEAEGILKGAIAIYEPVGKVRGYAKKADVFTEEVRENWQIGKLLGNGTINIIKDNCLLLDSQIREITFYYDEFGNLNALLKFVPRTNCYGLTLDLNLIHILKLDIYADESAFPKYVERYKLLQTSDENIYWDCCNPKPRS